MKKAIALSLAALLCLCVFSGCDPVLKQPSLTVSSSQTDAVSLTASTDDSETDAEYEDDEEYIVRDEKMEDIIDACTNNVNYFADLSTAFLKYGDLDGKYEIEYENGVLTAVDSSYTHRTKLPQEITDEYEKLADRIGSYIRLGWLTVIGKGNNYELRFDAVVPDGYYPDSYSKLYIIYTSDDSELSEHENPGELTVKYNDRHLAPGLYCYAIALI